MNGESWEKRRRKMVRKFKLQKENEITINPVTSYDTLKTCYYVRLVKKNGDVRTWGPVNKKADAMKIVKDLMRD